MSTPKCEEKVRVFVCACLEGRTGGVTKGWRGMGRSHLGVRQPSGASTRGTLPGRTSVRKNGRPSVRKRKQVFACFREVPHARTTFRHRGASRKHAKTCFRPNKRKQTREDLFPFFLTLGRPGRMPRVDAPDGRPGRLPDAQV